MMPCQIMLSEVHTAHIVLCSKRRIAFRILRANYLVIKENIPNFWPLKLS